MDDDASDSSDGDEPARIPFVACALSPKDEVLLGRGGYRDASDLEGVSFLELAADLKISDDEADRLLAEVLREAAPPTPYTMAELAAREATFVPCVSFCRALDDALGGGAVPRRVLELVGGPGTGKTQLCFQLAVDAAIPAAFHGLGSGCAFVDCDGSFAPSRVARLAGEMVKHVKRLARRKRPREGEGDDANDAAARRAADALAVDGVLENIAVFRALDHGDLFHAVIRAEALVASGACKLLIIDSVAAHLRAADVHVGVRSRLVARLHLELANVAMKYDVAVVVTNQLTTKLDAGENVLAPALGDAWANAAAQRLLLKEPAGDGMPRTATLLESVFGPEVTVPFAVEARGVRDYKPPAAAG